jgi:hypothetical protein
MLTMRKFTPNVVLATAVIAGTAFGLFGSSAHAATLLYNSTTAGTSSYPGDLVESFTVNQAGLQVNALAVYDSGKNGITSNLMVGLFDDTANSVAIAAVNFNGTAYNGTAGSYFDTMALSTPFALISGHTYSIEAWGFDATDGFAGGGAATFNPSTFSLTNVAGTGAVGNGATNVDGSTTGGLQYALCNTAYLGGTLGCTNDANLRFNGTDFAAAGSLVLAQTPLPAALPLFAGGLGLLGMFTRRRKQKASAIAAA